MLFWPFHREKKTLTMQRLSLLGTVIPTRFGFPHI